MSLISPEQFFILYLPSKGPRKYMSDKTRGDAAAAGWGPHFENHMAKETLSCLLEIDQSALKFLLNNKSLWYKMR